MKFSFLLSSVEWHWLHSFGTFFETLTPCFIGCQTDVPLRRRNVIFTASKFNFLSYVPCYYQCFIGLFFLSFLIFLSGFLTHSSKIPTSSMISYWLWKLQLYVLIPFKQTCSFYFPLTNRWHILVADVLAASRTINICFAHFASEQGLSLKSKKVIILVIILIVKKSSFASFKHVIFIVFHCCTPPLTLSFEIYRSSFSA